MRWLQMPQSPRHLSWTVLLDCNTMMIVGTTGGIYIQMHGGPEQARAQQPGPGTLLGGETTLVARPGTRKFAADATEREVF